MANQKIIERKAETVNEITSKVQNASSVVLFEYSGLSVADMTELRCKLRETDSELKIYKNTLAKRAMDSLKIDLGDHLNGPKAIAFGKDAIAPIKILSEFAKTHPSLQLKVGIVDGDVADEAMLKSLATVPSRDTLLTMLAAGMMGTVKDLSIALNLYSEKLGE